MQGNIGRVGAHDTGFMQLPDELLWRTVRLQTIEPALLELLMTLKLANKRLCKVLREQMRGDITFRGDLMHIFHVPGSEIPCWAETVVALPLPIDFTELLCVFNENAAMFEDNCVHVGGAYDCRHGQSLGDDSFVVDEEPRVYLAVEILFGRMDYFQPPRLPTLANNMADLRKMPNIFRRVLGFLGLTHDYTEIGATVKDVAKYMRLVRVMPHHTMQDVQHAIAYVEGWTHVEECMMHMECGDQYESDDVVFDEFHTASLADVVLRPKIWFLY